jgi:hypothetical protein
MNLRSIFLFISMCLLFLTATAHSSQLGMLKNDREGASFYFDKDSAKIISLTRTKVKDQLPLIWQQAEKTPNSLKCDFTLYESLHSQIDQLLYSVEFKDFLLLSRADNYIDDPVLDALAFVHQLKSNQPDLKFIKKHNDEISASSDELLKIYQQFVKSLAQKSCAISALKSVSSKIKSLFEERELRKFKFKKLKYYHQFAYEQKWISREQYVLLMQAYSVKLHQRSFDYANYVSYKSILRIQSPLYDKYDKSSFISQKNKKDKLSLRQSLYQRYDYAQILLMSNILKKLRSRLNSKKVEIHQFDQNGVLAEVIELAPMEIYYFAIDILRKEMSELRTNSLFQGKAPSYLDIIVAGFETGIIHSSEIEQIKLLEQVWNPDKTLYEKSEVWIRTFATLTSVLLPPPYGMIPILSLVIIEAIANQKNNKGATDESIYRLF